MANEINIVEVTNGSVIAKEWTGTGIFDTLLNAMNKNIELQYVQGRIVGKDYADVYLASLQTTLQQSIDYVFKKDLIYWQIEVAKIELEIKKTEAAIRKAELAASLDRLHVELEKQWGYDVTRDPITDEIVLSTSNGNGKIDFEIEDLGHTINLKTLEETSKRYEINNTQPTSFNILKKELEIKTVDKLLLDQKIVGKSQSTVIKE